MIIFSTGPMTGTAAPQSNRFVVTTKSPLTGAIGSSTCGGNFATKLKKAGVDLVLVRGKAKKPVYIEITEAGAAIKDAAHLWGKGALETQKLLPAAFGKAVIGPAGENLVRFACVVSEERVAGRTGCGAVMGSKNLKGIIANGNRKVEIAEKDKFKSLQKWMTKFLATHPMTGEILPRLGTANLVLTTAGRNILPVRNFSRGTDLRAMQISGEEMTAHHLKKRGGCTACPIKCGRGIERDGHVEKGPEYETLGVLSSNLGNFDLKRLFEWNYLCDDLGLDTISAGGVIGFAMELTARGLLQSELSFERHDNISQLLDDIAYRRGLGNDLAEGVKRMSDKYGGHDFAIHVKGLELPAYDPRGCFGQGLEYATTNRGGCHIQGATMFLEATGPLSVDPLSTKAKPELVTLQQNLSAAIGSSVFCMFSSYAMIPAPAFRMDPQGLPYKHRHLGAAQLRPHPRRGAQDQGAHPGDLVRAVSQLHHGAPDHHGRVRRDRGPGLQHGAHLQPARGLHRQGRHAAAEDAARAHLPGAGPASRSHDMLPRYYKVRGWDASGVPKRSTLDRLRIRQ